MRFACKYVKRKIHDLSKSAYVKDLFVLRTQWHEVCLWLYKVIVLRIAIKRGATRVLLGCFCSQFLNTI